MDTEKQNSSWVPTKKFFSDALLVAVLTGVGYLAAFIYQFSYLQYFNIPIFFVEVNLVNVLLTTGIGFLVLLGLGTCVDIFFSYDLKNKTLNIIKAILMMVITLLTLLVPILGLYFDLSNNIVLVIILITVTIIVILMVIYALKYPNQFRNKKTSDIFSLAEESFGSFPVLFTGILMFFIIYCGGIGKMVAQSTKNYLVSNTNPTRAIVSIYSGNFIGLTFNSSTKTFYKDMTLISADEISRNNIIFSNQNIGPLKAN